MISCNVRFDESNVLNKAPIHLVLATISSTSKRDSLQQSNPILVEQPLLPSNILSTSSTSHESSHLPTPPTIKEPNYPQVMDLPDSPLAENQASLTKPTRSTYTRQPSVKLKDSYTYSIEPTIIEQLFSPSIEYIQLFEPVEINCFWGVAEEPLEP